MIQQPTFQAALWDLDGTIIDTEPLWLEAETEMLRHYGLDFANDTRDRMIGSGLWVGAEVFRELGVPLDADAIVNQWTKRVTELYDLREPQWRPGAPQLLAELKHAGVPNVLVTMSTYPVAERAIQLLPDDTFIGLVTGDRVPRPKPFPDAYLQGAQLADTPIESCIAFEDSSTGLKAAASSGAVSVGVEHFVSLSNNDAHVLLDTLENVHLNTVSDWWTQYRGSSPTTGGYIDLRGARA